MEISKYKEILTPRHCIKNASGQNKKITKEKNKYQCINVFEQLQFFFIEIKTKGANHKASAPPATCDKNVIELSHESKNKDVCPDRYFEGIIE